MDEDDEIALVASFQATRRLLFIMATRLIGVGALSLHDLQDDLLEAAAAAEKETETNPETRPVLVSQLREMARRFEVPREDRG